MNKKAETGDLIIGMVLMAIVIGGILLTTSLRMTNENRYDLWCEEVGYDGAVKNILGNDACYVGEHNRCSVTVDSAKNSTLCINQEIVKYEDSN